MENTKTIIGERIAYFKAELIKEVQEAKLTREVLEEGFLMSGGEIDMLSEESQAKIHGDDKLKLAINIAATHVKLSNAEYYLDEGDIEQAIGELCFGCIYFGHVVYQ